MTNKSLDSWARYDIYVHLIKQVKKEMRRKMDKHSKECYRKELALLKEIQKI